MTTSAIATLILAAILFVVGRFASRLVLILGEDDNPLVILAAILWLAWLGASAFFLWELADWAIGVLRT